MMTEELGPRTEDYYELHGKTEPVVDPAAARQPIPAPRGFAARLRAILKRARRRQP